MLACSERELSRIASELAAELGPCDRVLLEGPMGSGKSTFARALIEALGVDRPPEGSPSFAIAHEYRATRLEGRAKGTASAPAEVIHLDFYRLRSEVEIEEAGISAYFWERDALVITEWISLFENFRNAVLRAAPPGRMTWKVELSFAAQADDQRNVLIEPLSPSSKAAQ